MPFFPFCPFSPRPGACPLTPSKHPNRARSHLYFELNVSDNVTKSAPPTMSTRERPHLRSSDDDVSRTSTGLRPSSESEIFAAPGAGRSGEYPAIRPTLSMSADDRLTPTEPLATAGRPLPTLQKLTSDQDAAPSSDAPRQRSLSSPALERLPSEPPRPRSLSNPAFERPYASLLPPSKRPAESPKVETRDDRRTTDPRVAPEPTRSTDPATRSLSEPPPSLRRAHSAGPPRRLGTCQIHRMVLSPTGDCVFCRREAESHARARWANFTVLIIIAVAAVVGLVLAR
jgi:hypothetical protein